MQFHRSYPTIGKSHSRNAFKLSPTSRTELLSQAGALTHGRTAGNSLYVAKLANDLKIHSPHCAMAIRRNHLSGPTLGFSGAAM